MQIKFLSDLYLDREPLPLEEYPTVGGILVLSGNIAKAVMKRKWLPFISWCSENFDHVIYVFGSYEHHDSSIVVSHDRVKAELANNQIGNVHVLENESIVIDDVVFIGATLWGDYGDGNTNTLELIRHRVSDFINIRTGKPAAPYNRLFKPSEALEMHRSSVEYVLCSSREAKQSGLKSVIVTHHVPICPPARSELSSSYSSDLRDVINDSQPVAWIHGGMSMPRETQVGTTRVVNNPRKNQTNFNPSRYIEV